MYDVSTHQISRPVHVLLPSKLNFVWGESEVIGSCTTKVSVHWVSSLKTCLLSSSLFFTWICLRDIDIDLCHLHTRNSNWPWDKWEMTRASWDVTNRAREISFLSKLIPRTENLPYGSILLNCFLSCNVSNCLPLVEKFQIKIFRCWGF